MLVLLTACTPREPGNDSADSALREGESLTLSGELSDPTGAPLPQATLQACADVCVAAWSDADGLYRFEGLYAGAWSIHAAGPSDDDAMLVIPWEIDADSVLDLIIPKLGPAHPVPESPSEVEVADGLHLTVSAENLPGVDSVRAALVAGPLWPLGPGLITAPSVGWSLSPLGAGEDIPFSALGEGEPWCTSEEGMRWEPCGGRAPRLGSIVLVAP